MLCEPTVVEDLHGAARAPPALFNVEKWKYAKTMCSRAQGWSKAAGNPLGPKVGCPATWRPPPRTDAAPTRRKRGKPPLSGGNVYPALVRKPLLCPIFLN